MGPFPPVVGPLLPAGPGSTIGDGADAVDLAPDALDAIEPSIVVLA
jgi:hypothetical protein